jgi:mannose-1-phosphate guanylyltransferase
VPLSLLDLFRSSDVGSWDALADVLPADTDNNIVQGSALSMTPTIV